MRLHNSINFEEFQRDLFLEKYDTVTEHENIILNLEFGIYFKNLLFSMNEYLQNKTNFQNYLLTPWMEIFNLI